MPGFDTAGLMSSLEAFVVANAVGFLGGTMVGGLAVIGWFVVVAEFRLWRMRRGDR